MKFKYNRIIAECKCHEHLRDHNNYVTFTTLTPLDNKTTKEDIEILDKVEYKLRMYGFKFWNGSVMLISHNYLSAEKIAGILYNHSILKYKELNNGKT